MAKRKLQGRGLERHAMAHTDSLDTARLPESLIAGPNVGVLGALDCAGCENARSEDRADDDGDAALFALRELAFELPNELSFLKSPSLLPQ